MSVRLTPNRLRGIYLLPALWVFCLPLAANADFATGEPNQIIQSPTSVDNYPGLFGHSVDNLERAQRIDSDSSGEEEFQTPIPIAPYLADPDPYQYPVWEQDPAPAPDLAPAPDQIDAGEDSYQAADQGPPAQDEPPAAPAPAEAEPRGSALGKLVVPKGLLQVWGVPYAGNDSSESSFDPVENLGFLIRRAQVGIDANVADFATLHFELNLQDSARRQEAILYAYIQSEIMEELTLRAGYHKIPYTVTDQVSTSAAQFADWAHTIQLFGYQRAAGFSAQGTLFEMLTYHVGIFNHADKNFSNRINPGFRAVARLDLTPLGAMSNHESYLDRGPLKVGLGVGTLYSKGQVADRIGVTGDLRFQIQNLQMTGALVWDTTEPNFEYGLSPAQSASINRLGWFVQAGYMILPKFLEATARVDTLDDNHLLENGGDARFWTVGMNIFGKGHSLKGVLNYTWHQELAGPQRDNNILLLGVQAAL